MSILTFILFAFADIVPSGDAFMEPLQPRDSVLIADQFEYGFSLDGVAPGTVLMLQDFSEFTDDSLVLVRNWQLDTVRTSKSGMDIRGSVVVSPFEEGRYVLPGIAVRRTLPGGRTDTLLFNPAELDVKTIPVDTATFEINDLKGQMRYPLKLIEVLPWLGGVVLLFGLAFLIVWLLRRNVPVGTALRRDEPPYMTALRALDRYKDEKYWAPDRQKAYYSGITDILKTYIDRRFGVDAPEMTTDELFDALKSCEGIKPEVWTETRGLFELADFVKFAKHVATRDENLRSLSTAVGFVTSTYQTELAEGRDKDVL